MPNPMKNILPNYKSKYYQSYYFPIHPEKYSGEYPILCRSLMERKVCIYLDTNPEITSWASEPFSIKYLNAWDNKEHNYYPDFAFQINEKKVVAEVKPRRQLNKPQEPKRKTEKSIKNYKTSLKMYVTNVCKVEAVKKFADMNNLNFVLITENEIKKLISKNAQSEQTTN